MNGAPSSHNLKAVLMAGGEGSRLRPLTSRRPKPLAPVAGKPVITYDGIHGMGTVQKTSVELVKGRQPDAPKSASGCRVAHDSAQMAVVMSHLPWYVRWEVPVARAVVKRSPD